jgi:hypothetical protein
MPTEKWALPWGVGEQILRNNPQYTHRTSQELSRTKALKSTNETCVLGDAE